MSLPSPVRAGARASKEQLCLRMIPPSSLLLADTMGHVRPADAIAGGSPTAPAPATLPLDASSGHVDVVAALLEEEHSARDSRDDSVVGGALRRCERAELSLLV
jgi:hypothetical protein